MKDIQQFNFKGNQFRGLTDEQGDPWFFGKDACGILNIDTNHLRDALDEDEITNLRNPEVWNQPGRARLSSANPACTSSL